MRRALALICAVIGAFLVFSVLSCDGEIPVDPYGPTASAELQASAYPAMHSAAGLGTSWYVQNEFNQGWLKVALSARLMPDGEAKGNFHWWWLGRDPGGRIFVKVSCLKFVDNEAFLLGQAVQAGNPANVGKWMGIWVADNGEGSDAPPDQILHRWFGPGPDPSRPEVPPERAVQFCDGSYGDGPGPRKIVTGNVKVR